MTGDFETALLGEAVMVAVAARPELGAVEVVVIRTEDRPQTLLLGAANAKRLGEQLVSVALNVIMAPMRRDRGARP